MKQIDRLSNKCFSSETSNELENRLEEDQRTETECAAGVPGTGAPGCPAGPGPDGSRYLLINCPPERLTKELLYILSQIWDDPIMNPHYDDVLTFMNWIIKTIDVRIVMRGYTHYPNGHRDEEIDPFTPIEYSKLTSTRYSLDYVKILLNRCYKFQAWIKGCACVMGAFTVPHEYNKFRRLKNPGMDHMACLKLIKKGWQKFRKKLHKRYKAAIPYVFMFEAHKMGYPHFHAILVGEFADADLTWMQKTWANCTGNSKNWEHALKFSDIREIEFPVAYLMKYLYKQLWENYTDWKAEDWLLNSLLWKTGTRSFQPSQNLQSIMKADRRHAKETDIFTHILAEGIPRKGGENEDLPVVIALPKKGEEEYTSDALRNPDLAPFIPIKARPAPVVAVPLCDRVKAWLDLPAVLPSLMPPFRQVIT